MDYQQLINIAIGATLSVLGWFARQLWDSVQELKKDLHKMEVDLPINYVRQDAIAARFDRIEQLLDKLYEKLESKQDK